MSESESHYNEDTGLVLVAIYIMKRHASVKEVRQWESAIDKDVLKKNWVADIKGAFDSHLVYLN